MRALALVVTLATVHAEAEPLRAPECGHLVLDPLPAIPLRAAGAGSLRASRRLLAPLRDERFFFDEAFADPDPKHQEMGHWQERRAILTAVAAIRAEPRNLEAWQTFLDLVARHDADLGELCGGGEPATRDRAAMRGAVTQAFEALRDATWAGCGPCADLLVGADVPDPFARDVERIRDSARAGPRTPIAGAARAIAAALAANVDEVKLPAEYVTAGGTVRANGRIVRGRAALERWLAHQSLMGYSFPGPTRVVWCDARCCHFPFADREPLQHFLTELCFDRALHLVGVKTEVTSP